MGSHRQNRGDEHLRVGVLRIVEHLVGQSLFHDHAALHHHQPVRQQTRDAEIVVTSTADR